MIYNNVWKLFFWGSWYGFIIAVPRGEFGQKATSIKTIDSTLLNQSFNTALRDYNFKNTQDVEFIKREARQRIDALEKTFNDINSTDNNTLSKRQRATLDKKRTEIIDKLSDVSGILNTAEVVSSIRLQNVVAQKKLLYEKEVDNFIQQFSAELNNFITKRKVASIEKLSIAERFLKNLKTEYKVFNVSDLSLENKRRVIDIFNELSYKEYLGQEELLDKPVQEVARFVASIGRLFSRLKTAGDEYEKKNRLLKNASSRAVTSSIGESIKKEQKKQNEPSEFIISQKSLEPMGHNVDQPLNVSAKEQRRIAFENDNTIFNELSNNYERGIKDGVPMQDYKNSAVYQELLLRGEDTLENLKNIQASVGIKAGSYIKLKGLFNKLSVQARNSDSMQLRTLHSRVDRFLNRVVDELIKDIDHEIIKREKNMHTSSINASYITHASLKNLHQYKNALLAEKEILKSTKLRLQV